MGKTCLVLVVFCATCFVSGVQPVCAAQTEPRISAAFFQTMMRLVGFNVITQPGPEAYPDLVTVEGINTSFMLGFPAGGIKRNAPFYLANDEYAAFVKFTDAGRFVVVGGDQRIIATGVFDAVTCTLGFISSLFVDTYLTIVYIFSGTMRPLTGIFSILLEILYTVFRIIFNCLPLLIPD